MESSSLPASPTPGPGTPLREATPDRLNQQQQQRDSLLFPSLQRNSTDLRDSSVHEKINQFNTMAMHSKALERRTADAALKRAMLGREEAESEMRRYREEARGLRKHVEEGRERERKVGERLETVMENYGRAKETHAHTQSLWEKEIRRARKETFKSQSAVVKLQEELKSARSSQKSTEESLDREKERSRAREQEAFQARYSLVGLQEQLDQALEQLKTAEQERDAFKTLARNEEDLARIAAEGRLPLPPADGGPDGDDADDEFASPRKKSKLRVSSISILDVKSSATSEAEIEELTRLWQWERQRADRASEHLEFLQAECQLKCCPCAKSQPGRSAIASSSPDARRKRPEPLKLADAGDLPILSEKAPASPSTAVTNPSPTSPNKSKTEKLKEQTMAAALTTTMTTTTTTIRRGTIFLPKEGIFRTVSQEEAEAMEAAAHEADAEEVTTEPCTPAALNEPEKEPEPEPESEPPMYARTPSVDPPAFALLDDQRASLLSLLDAPQQPEPVPLVFSIPTTPGPIVEGSAGPGAAFFDKPEGAPPSPEAARTAVDCEDDDDTLRGNQPEPAPTPDPIPEPAQRPHTTAGFYTSAITAATSTITTTTKVPLREETTDPCLATRLLAQQQQQQQQPQPQRTPSAGSNRASHRTPRNAGAADGTDRALTTPATMTREQALAQIQERRGRARSAAQGGVAATPRKQMAVGTGAASGRRDVSAPAGRSARRVRT